MKTNNTAVKQINDHYKKLINDVNAWLKAEQEKVDAAKLALDGEKAALDKRQEAIDKAMESYRAEGITNAHGYVCDVTDETAVKALVERIHAEVGPIHILVNNAGIIKRIPMHEMKREEFQQVIDIDLVAPYIVSAAVLPEMMSMRITATMMATAPM